MCNNNVIDIIINEGKLSAKTLADSLGCSQSFISLVKSNKRQLSLSALNKIIKQIENQKIKEKIINAWCYNSNINIKELNIDEKSKDDIAEKITKKILKNY